MGSKIVAAAGLSCLLLTAPARADSEAQAQVLFERGRALLAQQKWNQACPKFVASMKLDPSLGTLLNIAQCHEHEGALARALADYQKALRQSRSEPNAARRESVQRHCRKHIAQLDPRVPRLTIEVDGATSDLTLTQNGEPFPVEALGEPLPVDPGTIEVIARAGGKRVVEQVTLAETERITLVLRLKSRSPAPSAPTRTDHKAAPPAPHKAASSSPARTAGPTLPTATAPLTAMDAPARIIPAWTWITGGAGITLGGAGIAFAIDYEYAAARLRGGCDGDFMNCDFDPTDTNARKNRAIALGWTFGGSGAIALTAAVIGMVLGESAPSEPSLDEPDSEVPGVALKPWAAGEVAGLQLLIP